MMTTALTAENQTRIALLGHQLALATLTHADPYPLTRIADLADGDPARMEAAVALAKLGTPLASIPEALLVAFEIAESEAPFDEVAAAIAIGTGMVMFPETPPRRLRSYIQTIVSEMR